MENRWIKLKVNHMLVNVETTLILFICKKRYVIQTAESIAEANKTIEIYSKIATEFHSEKIIQNKVK